MSNRSITNERYTNQQIAACLFIERHKFQDNIFATNSKKKKIYVLYTLFDSLHNTSQKHE